MQPFAASSTGSPETRFLEISSQLDQLLEVEHFLEQLHLEAHFKADTYANIVVAVTEAVNNAILHGNRSVSKRTVQLTAGFKNPFLLVIRVQDEGPGFDHQNLPDPTDPRYLLEDNGRGVFIMRQLADSLTYLGNGNTVEMRFNI